MSDAACLPKLPIFKDGDDITSFLVRFERIAQLLSLNNYMYAVRLGSLLSGKAVDIYASLSSEITCNYELLKSALLVRFNKTSEGYRQEFRTAKIGPNEAYEQSSIRLGRAMTQWVESRTIEKDHEGLKSFMLADQFTASLSPELRLFIKEQNAQNLQTMVRLADNWSTARGAYSKSVAINKQSIYKPTHSFSHS